MMHHNFHCACARSLHIQAGVGRRAQPNAVLEKVFNSISKPLSSGMYCFYVIQLAFYWSLMFSQFIDIKRKAAKMANYAKYQRVCDSIFIVFSLVFFITRLIIYPIWVLNSTMFQSWDIVGPFPSWWVFNSLLLVLQVLHIIWSYLIARIAVKAMARGKVSNDVRSDIESSSEEEADSNGTNGHCPVASCPSSPPCPPCPSSFSRAGDSRES
uniref:TLC domain-containing protein n=1 Tax=Knipowitschia caucasica TaxID=637954 RepID=A0AAV2M8B7_KNICA